MNSALPQTSIALEDLLDHLPSTAVQRFGKGKAIYNPERPIPGIYLVIDGGVKVCQEPEQGQQVVIDVYGPDDFFGETALLGPSAPAQAATALNNATVMMWTAEQLKEIEVRRPRLPVALLQFAVRRSMDFVNRIESFSADHIDRRLARALIRFSERFGQTIEDGSVQLMPLTQELLAQYVGTSREIVTTQMNVFRKLGYLRYSREGIWLNREAMGQWLNVETRQSVAA